jgi:hypothetical protein
MSDFRLAIGDLQFENWSAGAEFEARFKLPIADRKSPIRTPRQCPNKTPSSSYQIRSPNRLEC